MRNKKLKKTKKRGGHIFYYEDHMGEKCRTGFLGMHDNDCWPTSLYLLGFLTYEMAQIFAMDERYVSKGGTTTETIIELIDEVLGEKHSIDMLYESGKDGKSSVKNAKFMAHLNYLMPYPYLGMPVTYDVYATGDYGNREHLAGHAFCVIRNAGGYFRIVDAQAGLNLPLNNLADLTRILPPKYSYVGDRQITEAKIEAVVQTTLFDEWHARTNHGTNYNVSPYGPGWYTAANNNVRERMEYHLRNNNEEGMNEEENNEYNEEGNNEEGNNENNEGGNNDYNGWYEEGNNEYNGSYGEWYENNEEGNNEEGNNEYNEEGNNEYNEEGNNEEGNNEEGNNEKGNNEEANYQEGNNEEGNNSGANGYWNNQGRWVSTGPTSGGWGGNGSAWSGGGAAWGTDWHRGGNIKKSKTNKKKSKTNKKKSKKYYI